MVGTNLPVDRLFAESATILRTIEAVVAPLSDGEQRAVLSGTAERVYRI
jgi:predicted TIM-barrel fold metal-dependent hydrolase